MKKSLLRKSNAKPHKKVLLTDRLLVLFFFVFNLGILFYANIHLKSLNELATRSIANASESKELEDFRQLEHAALSGSWENFEKIRLEEVEYYLSSHIQPSDGYSVYFFPETLPKGSFERSFVDLQLQPGLETLKKACIEKDMAQASAAYEKLSARVRVFELGESGDDDELSKEAKEFLRLYQELVKFNLARVQN